MSEIREMVEAAFNAPAEAPAGTTPADIGDVTPATPEPTQPAETQEQREARARDEKGRFAPKTATPAPKPAEPTATAAPAQTPATATEQPKPATTTATPPELRAPQSWRPEVREKWNALPEEVRREVLRRETESAREIQTRAEAHRFHEQFNKVVTPYQAMLQAEGLDPIRAVDDLLRTAAALRTAPPAHRAALVANMVRTFGVPIDALDAALAGEGPAIQPQQPAAPPQYRDPRLDQLLERAAQQRQQKMVQELSSFAASHEFIEDVRADMADIMEMSSKRGVELSLEDAYSRACLLHPEVSKVLEQRKAAQAAANATASTQAAKNAASSVRTQPAIPAGGGKGTEDLRSTLEAAWEAAAGR